MARADRTPGKPVPKKFCHGLKMCHPIPTKQILWKGGLTEGAVILGRRRGLKPRPFHKFFMGA